MESANRSREGLAKRWDFQWPILEVLLGGGSPIDLGAMSISTWKEATEFLAAYGYDPENPREKRIIHATFVEALAFIQKHLITHKQWNEGIRPPAAIQALKDIRWLVLWASGNQCDTTLLQAWACAILRVMHTIAHIEGVNRLVDLEVVRDQIFSHIRKFIIRDESNQMLLGHGDFCVKLSQIQWKDAKPRDSIILKLLHKRNNVAESIYDYVGIRIVVPRLVDVPLIIKSLERTQVLVYPNSFPARSRNNLLDFNLFKIQIEDLRAKLLKGSLTEERFLEAIDRMQISSPLEDVGPFNPHSSDAYRSVQLTGRFLVKFQYDGYEWLRKIKDFNGFFPQKKAIFEELEGWLTGWHSVPQHLQSEVFFPFEIQIMDQSSFEQAATGVANHEQYKKSQLKSARKRVMSSVVELYRLEKSAGDLR
jgi:uncharacterized protein (TIGR04562 family)